MNWKKLLGRELGCRDMYIESLTICKALKASSQQKHVTS